MRSTVLGIVVAGAVTLVACSGGGDDDSTPRATDTPEPTATQPADGDGGGDNGDEVLFGGKEVGEFFVLNCSGCHGADRAGITGLGLPLLPDVLTEDDDFYRDTISNGRAGTVMPAWSATGMSDDEITALIAFIRSEP